MKEKRKICFAFVAILAVSVTMPDAAHSQQIEELRMPATVKCAPSFAVRTNMLYDLAAIPNIGVELGLGRGWSYGADVDYGWWSNRDKFFWRTFAVGMNVRKYFGAPERGKRDFGRVYDGRSLTGHHIGIYGGFLTYDYELGGRGYISDYRESWSHYTGIDYGYSFPIAKSLNLDFSIGFGYIGGRYKEYLPEWDNSSNTLHYVWQATRDRAYFGPSRIEISLVWIIAK